MQTVGGLINPNIGMTSELKNFYSQKLLSRLVPALEHASKPYVPTEYEAAVRKWQTFLGDAATFTEPKNAAKEWDTGYVHAILSSVA